MEPIFLNAPTSRLRVRRVDERALAQHVKDDQEPGWRASVRHGGNVANCYGYRADTEAALAVRSPRGHVVVWMARLPANKVTLGGAADACVPGSRALWDSRYGRDAEKAAWWMIKKAFVKAVIAHGDKLPHLSVAEALAANIDDENVLREASEEL